MDELIKQIGETPTSNPTLWGVLFGLCLSAILSVGIAQFYKISHRESSYSSSYVLSLVVLSMIVAMIMLVIGSNIARAFSLVGALSIIRFRTAIRSPMDVTFIFFSLAVGMACGTRFYLVATLSTVLICGVVSILNLINFGSRPVRNEFLLAVQFHLDMNYEKILLPLSSKYFEEISINSVETVRQGSLREVHFSVDLRDKIDQKLFLDEIAELNGNLKVALRQVKHAADIP